jgi:metal transporter CNNM
VSALDQFLLPELIVFYSFMGQDRVHLQVIARSGTCKERQNAQKVLGILQKGRHWVLVSLLLGNVITNETLPIVLDQEVKGGWFAVLTSSLLVVIFGEIIPQSICAKYGLAVGAWSSRFLSIPIGFEESY